MSCQGLSGLKRIVTRFLTPQNRRKVIQVGKFNKKNQQAFRFSVPCCSLSQDLKLRPGRSAHRHGPPGSIARPCKVVFFCTSTVLLPMGPCDIENSKFVCCDFCLMETTYLILFPDCYWQFCEINSPTGISHVWERETRIEGMHLTFGSCRDVPI